MAGIDVIDIAIAKTYHDEHSGGSAVLVGLVSAGGSFPTTRPDGSVLQLGDFVKPTGTLPFTIGTITFTNANDQAVYAGSSNWLLNANPFQSTADTPTNVAAEESISGTALTQAAVNKEFVQKRNFVHEQSVAATVWNITHNMGKYPAVTVIDSAGSVCEGEIAYTDKNNVVLTFSAAFGGKAYLS